MILQGTRVPLCYKTHFAGRLFFKVAEIFGCKPVKRFPITIYPGWLLINRNLTPFSKNVYVCRPTKIANKAHHFKTKLISMKKYLLPLIVLLLGAETISAQGVAVSATATAPDASAILDVNSTAKGFLPPRMTTVQRDAIANPATGLIIYNSTTGCLNFWKQTAWYEVCGTCAPQPTQSNAGPDQLSLAGTSAVLAGNTPTNGTGAWSVVSGTGGSFVNAASPTTTFNGAAGQFYTLRWTITTGCGSSTNDVDISFAGGGPNIITLAQLRALYQGTDIKITTSTQITGVVISDSTTKSVSRGSVILQQGNAGVNVFFGGSVATTYNLGDSILIDITGDSLISFRGALEVKGAAAQIVPPKATGKTVVPKEKTIAEITAALALPLGNPGNFEYTLITVRDAALSGATANYSGNNTFTDQSGSMTFFTRTQATFASTPYPTVSANYTGYCYMFNTTPEFQIRNLNDVQ
jgi:hypothetical protein